MKTYSRKAMYRLTYSRAVVAMGQLEARRIAERIEERFGAYDIDADLIEAAILKDCDLLSRVTEELAAATTAVSHERVGDLLARTARDEQASRLGKILVASRARIRSELGADALKLYKLDQRTPEGMEAIGCYAAEVLYLLKAHPRQTDDMFGHTFDTATLVAVLEPAVERYDEHLDQVSHEQRKTQQARALRDRVEKRFRTVLVNVAASIESKLRMADLDALADRIRPIHARTRGAVAVEIPTGKSESAANATKSEPAARTAPPLAQSA